MIARTVTLPDSDLNVEQTARAQRVHHLLKQCFSGNRRVENIFRVHELKQGIGACNGYELFRLLRFEFSLKTRAEAFFFRTEFLEMKVHKSENLSDILRRIDAKYFQFIQLIQTFPYPQMVADVAIPESDVYTC